MPEIPRYSRQQTIPGESGGVPVNPAAASMSYEAVEKGGKAIAGLGEEAMRYAIVEQRAERALKAMKFETDLKNDVDATAESYAMRSDYDKFDNDVQANIALLKQKHVDSIDDPVLKRAAEATFGKQSYELQKVIRDKKRVLMTEEATNQYGVKYNNALKEYAYSTSPEEKEFIRNNVALEGYELEKSHLLKLGSTEKLMQAFNGKAANNYAQELTAQNPEVAFAALTERDSKGQYTKFADLDPEDRIARQKEARSAIVTNYYEIERKERELQEATKSDLFNKLDNKAYSRSKLLAEVQAAEIKDPVTGTRRLPPETAHALRKIILNPEESGEGNSAEFIRLGNRIVGGQMSSTDEIIQSKGLKANEKKVLANMFWTEGRRDDKALTAEEKAAAMVFKNNKKFIMDSANKQIDAMFPTTDSGDKALKNSLKSTVLTASGHYGADTINDFRQYVDDTLKYAKDQASTFGVSKKKVAKAILGAVKPDTGTKTAPAPEKTEKPPMEGAKKAPDGKWYVEKQGKFYEVR
jgi:hypothetical protein